MTPSSVARRPIRFDHWEVRPAERCLLVRGQPVEVGDKAFDVLLALAARPGQPVSRDELLDAAWPGLYVEANNVSVQVHGLRRLLGSDAIKTVAKVGYQLACLAAPAGAEAGDDPAAPADATCAPEPAPAPASANARGNLGAPPPRLYGRASELADVASLIRRHPLVRVVGIGGAGKTRLAQAVGHLLAPEFAGGAWLVELAPVVLVDACPTSELEKRDDLRRQVDMVATTVARSLELLLPGIGTPFDEVIVEIGTVPRLLILDNCEHLHEAVELFVKALLEGGRRPELRVLVTSQKATRLPDLQEVALEPLEWPKQGASPQEVQRCASAELLVARVQALQPGFQVDARNAADIGAICRGLGGLPLALELVAARVRLLGTSEVLSRISHLLPLLSRGASTLAERQQSMTAALDWSYGQLAPVEQVALDRLGVFAGSFNVEMALRVLADDDFNEWAVLDGLGALADMSLLSIDGSDPPRCHMLATTREYAQRRLAKSADVQEMRRRHARAVIERFERSQACRWDLASQDRTTQFVPDLDDALAALAWTRANGQGAWYVELAGACAWLWESTGQVRQGQELCQHGLDLLSGAEPGGLAGLHPEHDARLLLAYCSLAHYKRDPEKLGMAARAVALLEGVLGHCGDRGDDVERVERLLYAARGRFAITAATNKAEEQGLEATRLMAQAPYQRWGRLAEWDYINACDYVVNQLGDLDEADRLAAQGRALARREGDLSKQLFALIAREQGVSTRRRFRRAVRCSRLAVAFSRRLPFAEKLAVCLANLVSALIQDDQLDEARKQAVEMCELEERADSLWQDLEALALLALKTGAPEVAARAIGCSIQQNEDRNGGREPVESAIFDEVTRALRQALGEARLGELIRQGRLLTPKQAAEAALRAGPVTAATA